MDAAGRMPSLFLGHGSPMNAIEDSRFRSGWAAAAGRLPRPRAVLCISAHWETGGPRVTAAGSPETIHDFGGFPDELYAVRYPAPGSPALAERVVGLLGPEAGLDPERGLDHGCWSVLGAMYPEADVPVIQLSLDQTRSPAEHYELARALCPLRDERVLVLGSGNVVHNLRRVDFAREDGEPWAVAFDAEVRARFLAGDHDALVAFESLTPEARLAVPTSEHYLPLLYVLGQRAAEDELYTFNEGTLMASLSMTCFQVGGTP